MYGSILFFFLALTSLSSPATETSPHCLASVRQLSDTGIEMETELDHYMTLSRAVIELSTTPTGTLAPILAGHPAPKALLTYLENKGLPTDRDALLELRWKSLPASLRGDILDELRRQELMQWDQIGAFLPSLELANLRQFQGKVPALKDIDPNKFDEAFRKLPSQAVPDDVLETLARENPSLFFSEVALPAAQGEIPIPEYINWRHFPQSRSLDRVSKFLQDRRDSASASPSALTLKQLTPSLQADFLELWGAEGTSTQRDMASERRMGITEEFFEGSVAALNAPEFLQWKKNLSEEGLSWTRYLRRLPPKIATEILLHYGVRRFIEKKRNVLGRFIWNDNRSIPGLLPPPHVVAHFSAPTSLFGKTYPPGRHRVPTATLFEPLVETLGPSTLPSDGLELKLRAGYREGLLPSQVVDDTWKLQELMGLERTGFHTHVVGELSSSIEPSKVLELERRLGLLSAFSYIENREPISQLKDSSGINLFGPPRSERYRDHVRTLLNLNRVPGSAIPEHKTFVDFRGTDVYGVGPHGKPNGGYDFRVIAPDRTWPILAPLLDRVQTLLRTPHFGIRSDEGSLRTAEQFEQLLWNRELPELLIALPQSIRSAITPELENRFSNWCEEPKTAREEQHLEVKLLLQDWSLEPTLQAHPEKLNRIKRYQLKALKALEEGALPLETTRQFLIQSGLRRHITESIGAKYVEMPTE
jgi:hypothetical protein